MNCKPGDLAVFVKGPPENIGIFARVIKCDWSDNTWTYCDASRPVQMWCNGAKDGAYSSTAEAGGNAWLEDRDIRPIRDSDGTDEMIRIAGLPQERVT